MKRVNVTVYGEVTGVFYRKNTKEQAIELGCKGTVKNVERGCVSAVFEGEDEAVDKMAKAFTTGLGFTTVERSEITEEEYKGEFENFEINYG